MAQTLRELKDRAVWCIASGRWEAALADYQRVVETDPEDLASRQKVAELLQRLGRTHEALEAYESVVTAWAQRGWLLRAIALCKVILQLEPEHDRTRQTLARLHARHRVFMTSRGPGPAPAAVAPGVVHALRSNPLLSALEPFQHEALARLFQVVSMPAGQTLLTQDQPGEALYLLLRGGCDVLHRHREGHQSAYPSLREGEVFGELSLLLGMSATATVRTRTPCTLLRLGREACERHLFSRPGGRAAFSRLVSERLGRTAQLLSGLAA